MGAPTRIDAIVIGAGLAGLAAAERLGASGQRVLVLEARSRTGGRVLSVGAPGWPQPADLGAEFFHGSDEGLDALAREAGVGLPTVQQLHWSAVQGRIQRMEAPWDKVEEVLRLIDPNTRASLATWLDRATPTMVDPRRRELVERFCEGFHAAPPERLSAGALASIDGGGEDRRVRGGYARIIERLVERLPGERVALRLSAPVDRIRWRPGRVEVLSGAAAQAWTARAVLLTVPLGVLQAPEDAPGGIEFVPPLSERRAAWRQLGFGHVQRLLLRFSDDLWRSPLLPPALREDDGRSFGFLHTSGPEFPVWWSQAPHPVLVGWWGGPSAATAPAGDEQVLKVALASLSRGLGVTENEIRRNLVDWRRHDWSSDIYARGAYSFATAGEEEGPAEYAKPVADTLFFAGEAFAQLGELGTTMGAYRSGREAASALGDVLRRTARRRGRTWLRVTPA